MYVPTVSLQTWNFDHSAKLYSHTQNNHCIRITAYPQPMFSRLAVGWAATSGGGAGLAIFVICGLVYLKKKRLACCGQYSGVAPEGKEEDEIVGYTELEVNSCVRPMEHRQVQTPPSEHSVDTVLILGICTYVGTHEGVLFLYSMR